MVFREALFQNGENIVVRLSGMYRQGLSEVHDALQLTSEYVALDLPRRVIVVVIEPHFTPSDTSGMRHGIYSVSAARSIPFMR